MNSTIIAAANSVGEINHQMRTMEQKEGIQQVKEKLGQSVYKT